MKYLVTGAAGFIGMHTCLKLLKKNYWYRLWNNATKSGHWTTERHYQCVE